MISISTLRKMALSFPEAGEEPHFEKTSFRVGKKIFATYDSSTNEACFKLSAADQDVFSLYDKEAISPLPNKWGAQGWTTIRLAKVRKDMCTDALTAAYCTVAPKRLAQQVKPTDTEEKAPPPTKTAVKKTTAKAVRTTAAGTKASEPEKVDEYMRALQHPLHDVATALRKFILSIDNNIGEEIAWNAPTFFYTGHMQPFAPKEYKRYIVGFNLFQKNCVRLIFLRGAAVTDTTGLLQGDYKDGRRLALFYSTDDIKKNEKALKSIIQQLVTLIPNS